MLLRVVPESDRESELAMSPTTHDDDDRYTENEWREQIKYDPSVRCLSSMLILEIFLALGLCALVLWMASAR